MIGGGNGPVRYERKGPTAFQMLCACKQQAQKVFAFPPMTQTSDFLTHGPPSSAVCTCPQPFRVLDHKFVATNTSILAQSSEARFLRIRRATVAPWYVKAATQVSLHSTWGPELRNTKYRKVLICHCFQFCSQLLHHHQQTSLHPLLFPRRTLNNLASTRQDRLGHDVFSRSLGVQTLVP